MKESTGDKASAVPRALDVLAWTLWSPGLCSAGQECNTTAPEELPQPHRALFWGPQRSCLLSLGCSSVDEERLWVWVRLAMGGHCY